MVAQAGAVVGFAVGGLIGGAAGEIRVDSERGALPRTLHATRIHLTGWHPRRGRHCQRRPAEMPVLEQGQIQGTLREQRKGKRQF